MPGDEDKDTETEHALHARETGAWEPIGCPLGWDRCPSNDSCQPPGMMGTQQVQRRGRRPKGNPRKQPRAGHPAQAVGPVPSSPFSDPLSLRHKHTDSCSPGRGLRAILDGLDYTGVTIHARQNGQDKEETRFRF